MTGTYLAPAKINLGLEVLFKRPDGYHELNTLFCRVDEPHDVITVSPAAAFLLTSSEPHLVTDRRNLVIRAAEAFSQKVGLPIPRLHIHLTKSIPMGAGLGGGSSDAASMLTILNDWYASEGNSPLSEQELMELAAPLGADVPFFLLGTRLATARGIGEQLQPIPAHPFSNYSIIIIFDPTIHISTAAAYGALTLERHISETDYLHFLQAPNPLKKWKETLRNDFEPEAFRKFPTLAHLKYSLYSHGAGFALMSGSGSALYGIFGDLEKAQSAKHAFENQGLQAFLS